MDYSKSILLWMSKNKSKRQEEHYYTRFRARNLHTSSTSGSNAYDDDDYNQLDDGSLLMSGLLETILEECEQWEWFDQETEHIVEEDYAEEQIEDATQGDKIHIHA